MKTKRGKRTGLRARSKNARTAKKPATRVVNRVLAVMHVPVERERQAMVFHSVDDGAPPEGKQILVRLSNDAYRYGLVMEGHFAAYDHYAETFVTFAHPERITHWMVIDPPVPPTAKAEGESAQPQDLSALPGASEEEATVAPSPYEVATP